MAEPRERNWREWISHRFGFGPIWDNFFFRRVPRDPWYAGDGMAMLLLMAIQFVTGIVLSMSYSPSVETAYHSVHYITYHQTLGWFVRGLHYWSGGLWVVLLVWHLFRQILIGGYKEPREGTWLIGVVLFFVVITMSFLGYALRWDERAVYGIKVALNHFYRVPLIGEHLVDLIKGGPELSTLTLTRIFTMHVIVLPLVLLALVAWHVYLIVLRGTVAPTEQEIPIHSAEQQKQVYKRDAQHPERGEQFFPTTQVRLGHIAVITFVLVMGLTLWRGAPAMYAEANLTRESFPVEEWWWAWYSALAALLPPWLAPWFYFLFPLVLFGVLVALPFVDRGPYRGIRQRPIAIGVVSACAIALISLSALRMRSPWTGWPSERAPAVPAGIELSPQVEQGRELFARFGCNSCHAVAGDGPGAGPDLARLDGLNSRSEIRDWILRPPHDVAMPSYAGRLRDEELERIIDYVMVAQTFPRRP